MAEYYPLLKRAVAGMPNASADSRRAIYERARKALLGQLRAMQPPVPEPDIERESRALDAAIEQLERELAPAAAPVAAAPAPAAPAAPPPAPTMRVAPMPAASPAPPAAPAPASPAAAAPSRAPTPQPQAPPPAPRAPAPPPVAPPPPRPPAATAAPAAAPAHERPVAPPPAAPASPSVAPAPPPAAPVAPPRAAPPIQPRPPVARSAPPPPPPAPEAPPAVAAEPDEPPALDIESDLRARPLRPAAPAAAATTERRGVLRYVLVGMALALVLGGIGYAAYVLRDRPEEIARARPEPAAPAPAGDSGGKIVERIGGGAPAPAAESTPIPTVRAPTTAIRPPGAAPAPAPTAAPQTAPPAGAAPGVAVAQRSALLIENKQGSQPDVFIGTTVWRADQGVLRAEIDIPEAKLKASMALQKNADLTLAASHTMELRFDAPAGDLAIGKIGAPELRREDMANGDRLAAVAVPIAAGYWLVGLARGERDVQYNLDLMRGRGWFDIPIQLADGRIAKLTFEKGAPGERALADASAAW